MESCRVRRLCDCVQDGGEECTRLPLYPTVHLFVSLHLTQTKRVKILLNWNGEARANPILPQHGQILLRQPLAILVVIDTLGFLAFLEFLTN